MNPSPINNLLQRFVSEGNMAMLRNMGGPIFIIMILAMMILPLPPFILDLLFTFNIALGLMVLLVSMYTTKPLEFAAFPTVLLLTTLLRLSLNVASTRVVLINGHTGPDAAGKVIEAFGHFLVGGNFAVGLVVFAILIVINFVVVTKGAGRIAEVSARFTLDAMPGKQMAIDADLNAGLIAESEARRRRTEIAQEADFYGAMDGASKFVRGDAVAGILILFINIIGGLAIGLLQHDLSLATAANNYVLLAIGDGLVAQIPALVISIAAGLVVSRVGDDIDIGSQIVKQLFNSPQALSLTAGVIGMMGLIPGMPHVSFLSLAGLTGWLSYSLAKKQKEEAQQATAQKVQESLPKPESTDASWEDLQPVDVIGLEVGYRLIPLVDKSQDGDLLKRIKGLRKKFAQEIGFLPPVVHIRDNLELKPNGYRILLKGVVIGEGEVFHGLFMAINPGRVSAQLQGTAAKDPAFGLPAVWIEANQRDLAVTAGYTVVDPATVVATHINHIMQTQAATLLGRAEAQELIDHVAKTAPKLVEDLVPKLISLSTVQRVLQSLLDEGVHIRDMRTIIETLCEHGGKTQDPADLTAQVRIALGRAIVQSIAGTAGDLNVVVFDPDLEKILSQASVNESLGLEPGLADRIMQDTAQAAQRQETIGHPPLLLVPDRLRLPMARLFKRFLPRLRVLSHSEIPESRTIRVGVMIGAKS